MSKITYLVVPMPHTTLHKGGEKAMQTSDYQSSSSSNGFEVRYLILSSEPVERRASARPTFSYHNRYLVKRRVLRRLRQLRRDLSRE